MDRSSLRRVPTTNDTEKRIAFKEKLAQRLDIIPADELNDAPATAPTLPVGSTVWHPDLGACTIYSVNQKKNSIVLESASLGKIDLVLSQVESKLIPDKDGVPALVDKDSPPLMPSRVEASEAVSSTNWTRVSPEAVAATEKILATKPAVAASSLPPRIPVGSLVWHPDLGACTVFSINEKKNSIVLESASLGRIDLVLSQVESKLIPDKDGAPALVDKASPSLEASHIAETEAVSPTDWRRVSPEVVAATEKRLTAKPKSQTNSAPPQIPVGAVVWHPDLGACTVFSVDEKKNSIVLDFTDRGKIDMVLSQVSLRLIPDKNGNPDLGREAPSSLEPSQVEAMATVSPTEWRRIAPEEVAAAERRIARQPKTSSEPAPVANGMPVGTLVWHPGLGPCTIFAIDRKKNSIILESAGLGKVDLILSQIESKLIPDKNGAPAYIDKLAPAFVEPTLIDSGEALSHTNWHRADQPTIYTEKKAPVAKERVKEAPGHLPVGSSVWHPNFGACTVSSINPKTNTIVLDFATFGSLDMVLSQVEPKLLPLDGRDAPVHSLPNPSSQSKKRQAAKPAPIAATTPRLSITLPAVFKSWKPTEQFSYLTKDKHLTTEAANEFVAVLSGRFDTPQRFDVSWDEVLDKTKKVAFKNALLDRISKDPVVEAVKVGQETDAQPLTELASLSVTLPAIFSSLQPSGQYSYLTQTKHLTPDEANDVIAVHLGNDPRSPVRPEIIWDDQIGLTQSGVQRTFKAPLIKVEVPVVRKVIDLPQVFKAWKPVEQYQYLTTSKHLTSVDANNVIEAVTYQFACDFDIVWEELPETEKRLAYKQKLLNKIQAAVVAPPQLSNPLLSDALTHIGVERSTAQVEVTKKVTVPGRHRLAVVLPHEFKVWNASDQYTFFTKTKKLTPNEANDLISVYSGKQPQDLQTEYEFIWDTLAVGLDPSQVRRSTDTVEREEREIVSKLQKLSVTLPQIFRTWRTAEQFSFLTHAKRLSAEEANNILAVYGGKSPFDTSIQFKIVWENK